MKIEEIRKLLEQQRYIVTEEEIDEIDGNSWRVRVVKEEQNWGANGNPEQPFASAYQNLVALLNKHKINHPDGRLIVTNDIEWPAPESPSDVVRLPTKDHPGQTRDGRIIPQKRG